MKFLTLLSFLSFLPGVVFAQRDIGELIFRDILKMNTYPGSPFTGNIINDIVMFLFIPTVFIIVIIYTLAGRLTDNTKIDLLLSVAFYLFIVFGGYYSIFALLAGPYFLFLLIVMGLFYFFLGHFGLRRAGTGGGGGRAQGMPGRAVEAAVMSGPQGEANLTVQLLRGALSYGGQIDILNRNMKTLEADYSAAKKEHNDRLAQSLQQQVTYLKSLKHYLEQQHRFNPTPSPVPV